jgi:hypothetical protein
LELEPKARAAARRGQEDQGLETGCLLQIFLLVGCNCNYFTGGGL